jgi:NADH:ubiquinone oxidoreductase subunit 4 (subunit M)
MINLGFSTAGLFFLAGFIWERLGNTDVRECSGLAKKMPLLATFFLIIGMASIGLPGTNGFIGEFLILLGAFQAWWVYGAIAVTGVIFAAAYFLWYYERAIFGPLKETIPAALKDLNSREWAIGVRVVGHDFLDRDLSLTISADDQRIGAGGGGTFGFGSGHSPTPYRPRIGSRTRELNSHG